MKNMQCSDKPSSAYEEEENNIYLKYKMKKYPESLSFSKIEQQSTMNSQPIEFEIIVGPVKSETFELRTEIEVKTEQTDCSDFKHNLPLTQISKIKSNKESLPKTSKKVEAIIKTGQTLTQTKNKAKSNKKTEKPQAMKTKTCEDKVKIIFLTEEEMLEGRKSDALNSKYLTMPYKCEKCIMGFNHETFWTEHVEKKHKKTEGALVCNICESVFNTKPSYKEHNKSHYKRYECLACGQRNNNKFTVLKHYNETHGKMGVTYACKLCDFTTESHPTYRYHRDRHRLSRVACEECGNTFVTKASLRVHMFTVHKQSNRMTYPCECGKVYRTKCGLNAHVSLVHAESLKSAYCATCDLNFRSELGLKYHLKTASRHVTEEDKRFSCNKCEAKFLRKKQLQEHIDWVHLNCTDHKCSKCSKSFKNEKNLKRHLLSVHDKIRPPRNKICDHCGKGFTSSTILRSHIRTHTGERPLQCTHCSATFAHSAALYTHKKLLHKQN